MTTVARLRALVTVADTGSVRQAARRLSVTESAVSSALSALAREVRVPLVERNGRGLRLTASGHAYSAYARAILGLHEEGLVAARADRDPERGRVRVAAVSTAGEHLLPAALASFLASHPTVDIGLEVGSSERLWSLFSAHEVDLVIGGRPPRQVGDAVVRASRPNLLVVVAAPAVAAGFDVARTRWLQREAGSGTRVSRGDAAGRPGRGPAPAHPRLRRCRGGLRRGGARRHPGIQGRGGPPAGRRRPRRDRRAGDAAAPSVARRDARLAAGGHGAARDAPAGTPGVAPPQASGRGGYRGYEPASF
jgi:DNA-binding transcriptional LysR family regulator